MAFDKSLPERMLAVHLALLLHAAFHYNGAFKSLLTSNDACASSLSHHMMYMMGVAIQENALRYHETKELIGILMIVCNIAMNQQESLISYSKHLGLLVTSILEFPNQKRFTYLKVSHFRIVGCCIHVHQDRSAHMAYSQWETIVYFHDHFHDSRGEKTTGTLERYPS